MARNINSTEMIAGVIAMRDREDVPHIVLEVGELAMSALTGDDSVKDEESFHKLMDYVALGMAAEDRLREENVI